jgi:hypothetical protein
VQPGIFFHHEYSYSRAFLTSLAHRDWLPWTANQKWPRSLVRSGRGFRMMG